MTRPEISVVIPVYNNEGALVELASRLLSSLSNLVNHFEVIFVDDGSLDKSAAVLRDIALQHSQVKVVFLSRNFGQHPAISAGFDHARGDVIVLMDADLEDRPEDISLFVSAIRENKVDVVYCVKKNLGDAKRNRLTSKLYHYVFSRLIARKIPANIGTFRAFNRKFLMALRQFKEANVLYGPLMFYMGFESTFIEVDYSSTDNARSSYTFSKRLKLATDSLISYTDIPHRVSLFMGAVLFVGSFLYSIIILLQYLAFGVSLPSGSTLILLVLVLTLGSLMIFLGVIGNYIFRVYQEVLGRPRYLITEKLNLESD